MRLAGVNVFPAEDSSKYVSIRNKHPIIVERLYEQIALTASAMAYSSSRWNSEEDEEEEESAEKKEEKEEEEVEGKSEKILFQAFEPLKDEPVTEVNRNTDKPVLSIIRTVKNFPYKTGDLYKGLNSYETFYDRTRR